MSINRVFLLGNLGKDPELRYTPSQQSVCSFSLATSESRKGADGERIEQTEWHNIVVWGKQAENCKQYLSKGRQVFVEGRIQTRKWQDQQGNVRYTTEIIASNVQFIGGRDANVQSGPTFDQSSDSSAGIFGEPVASGPTAAMPGINTPISLEDDDIPF